MRLQDAMSNRAINQNISQSEQKSIEELKRENERLHQENLRLGKQLQKITFQQFQEKSSNEKGKSQSNNKDIDFYRGK